MIIHACLITQACWKTHAYLTKYHGKVPRLLGNVICDTSRRVCFDINDILLKIVLG